MGFDMAVLGEITFPSSAKRTAWHRAVANPDDHEAEAELMGFDVDDAPLTVQKVLSELAQTKPRLLEIQDQGERFHLRAVLDKDVWGELGSKLMAATLAAERAGGVGSVRFVGYIGVSYGVAVEVEKGKSGARKLTKKELAVAEEELVDLRETIGKRTIEENVEKAAKIARAPAFDVGPLVERMLLKDNPGKEVSRDLIRASPGSSAAIVEHVARAVAEKRKKLDYKGIAVVMQLRGEHASGTAGLLPLYERPAAFSAKPDDLKEEMAQLFVELRDPPGLEALVRGLDALLDTPKPQAVRKEMKLALQALLFLNPTTAFDKLSPLVDVKRRTSERDRQLASQIFGSMRLLVRDPTSATSIRWIPLAPLDPRWAEAAAPWLDPAPETWLGNTAALVLAGLEDGRGQKWFLEMFKTMKDYSSLNVPDAIAAIESFGDPRAAAALEKSAKHAATPQQARLFTNAATKLAAMKK